MVECHPDRDEQPKQTVVTAAQWSADGHFFEQTDEMSPSSSAISASSKHEAMPVPSVPTPVQVPPVTSQPRNHTQKRTPSATKQTTREWLCTEPRTSTSVITPMLWNNQITRPACLPARTKIFLLSMPLHKLNQLRRLALMRSKR